MVKQFLIYFFISVIYSISVSQPRQPTPKNRSTIFTGFFPINKKLLGIQGWLPSDRELLSKGKLIKYGNDVNGNEFTQKENRRSQKVGFPLQPFKPPLKKKQLKTHTKEAIDGYNDNVGEITQSNDMQSHEKTQFLPKNKLTGMNQKVVNQKQENDNSNEMLQSDDVEPGFDLTNEEIKKMKLWPKGNIPYYIDVRSFNDKVLRDRIRAFLNDVNSLTSLNFMELSTPLKNDTTRWVFFINRRGLLDCADHSIKNFTNQGVQQVVLGYDCLSTGKELPEAVLAIAGVPPQHNAPDRNKFIKINEDNIVSEKKYLFEKLENKEWLFHEVDYDFSSAGHYHNHKYSANGRATIEAQDKYSQVTLGEKNRLSSIDIWKINVLYNYISRKIKDRVLQCNKLFIPGIQFKNYRPTMNLIKPRKKPNKYLGLSEENDSVAKSIDKSESEIKEDGSVESSRNRDTVSEEFESTMKPATISLLNKEGYYTENKILITRYSKLEENYRKNIRKEAGVQYMKFTATGKLM